MIEEEKSKTQKVKLGSPERKAQLEEYYASVKKVDVVKAKELTEQQEHDRLLRNEKIRQERAGIAKQKVIESDTIRKDAKDKLSNFLSSTKKLFLRGK